jgi:phenylalanyl-tRNA synthetase beta chain
MLFSLKWLKEYVEINVTATELADKMNLAGQEVESLVEVGKGLCNIITGKITKIEKHPNADKLVITQIFDGKDTHQIVTGATNIFEGAIVPASLPGAVLANGLKIKNSQLRGIDSNGMLCSEVELGAAQEADGIWILPEDTPLGVDFVEYANLQDTLLDIGVLPNRGDCQSIYGMAREISTILGSPLKKPETQINEINETCQTSIELAEPELCPLYTGRLIKDVKNNKTPLWMQRRLQLSGIRPLGLLIDITNYVLLELGQPLHAFDNEKIENSKIIIRKATQKERFTTLDDIERELTSENLLICDGKKSVALAGVMGGKNSEISDTTTDIFLESAYFFPSNVRKTASKLGLRTESVIRFEKGVDPEQVELASQRASHLYQELANGKVVKDFKIQKNQNHPHFQNKELDFSVDAINKLLGSSFNQNEMQNTLQKLGFSMNQDKITIPSWRRLDIQELPCIAEEIARMLGFENIPSTMPLDSVIVERQTKEHKLSNNIKTLLINNGFFECQTFTMIAEDDFRKTDIQATDLIKLQNPLTIEESVMRTHMLPSLLKTASFNLKRQAENLKIFEIGKTFISRDQKVSEELHCTALIIGERFDNVYRETDKKANNFDIYNLKGLTNLLTSLGLPELNYQLTTTNYLHPKQALAININKQTIGEIGVIHPTVANNYEIEAYIYYLDININKLTATPPKKVIFKSISKFPQTRRDIAILAPKTLPYNEIEDTIKKFKPKNTVNFFVFDCFESEKIGTDKKSLAFGFIYQNNEKTLSDEEVNKAHEKFCNFLTQKLPITIR